MTTVTFLLVQPQGKDSQKERELQDAVARAHAARASHRRKKIELLNSRPLALHQRTAWAQNATRNPSPATEDAENDERSLSIVSTTSVQQRRSTGFPLAHARRSLQTVLGESLVDPFESSPVRNIPRRLLDALEYAWGFIWPTLHPDGEIHVTHPDIRRWRKTSTQNPVLFHTHMSGAAGLALALQSDNELSKPLAMFRLSHANTAMKLVSDQIRDLKGPPSDALIMSVLTLGVHAGDVDESESGHSHPMSPLATAQNLHAFGRMALAHAHVKALEVLVRQKGGYPGIELHGLAALIYLNDIQYATRTGGRPAYPNLTPYQSLVTSGKHILDSEAVSMSAVLGTGFIIDGVYNIDQELSDAVQSACEATVALDHYNRRGAMAPSILILIEARNAVQHRLCDLPPRALEHASIEDLIYEACRRAALVYSDMVLWPMPPGSGVKPRLSREIRHLLAEPLVQQSWDLYSDVLLWVVLMGGIASTFTPDHSFYVEQLHKHTTPSIETLAGFKSLMKLYLWWDYVVDEPASRLWFEAQQIVPSVPIELHVAPEALEAPLCEVQAY